MYNRVNWQEKPSTSTPINAANLNNMDAGIKGNEAEIALLPAKNIIEMPYYTQKTSGKINGIRFTVNSDGSVTVNGTATNNATFYVRNRNEGWKPEAGNYILTGCPEGGSGSKYYLYASYGEPAVRFGGGSSADLGGGVEGELPNLDSEYGLGIYILIPKGYTANNLTFKPMFIQSEIKRDYIPSEECRLADRIDAIENEFYKNINSTPYVNGASYTRNGITFTVNADGSVTANGTATSTASYYCHQRSNTTNPIYGVKDKAYTVTGCPEGGSSTTYRIVVAETNAGGGYSLIGYDDGDGQTIIPLYGGKIDIQINIYAGQTVENLVFKPQLVEGYKKYPFKPYEPEGEYVKNTVLSQTVTLAANSATSANFTLAGANSIKSVAIKRAWPQSNWTNGALVSVLNWTYNGTTLSVAFTTTSAQAYQIELAVIYN